MSNAPAPYSVLPYCAVQGLPVEEKVVQRATKQRTLKRNV